MQEYELHVWLYEVKNGNINARILDGNKDVARLLSRKGMTVTKWDSEPFTVVAYHQRTISTQDVHIARRRIMTRLFNKDTHQ